MDIAALFISQNGKLYCVHKRSNPEKVITDCCWIDLKMKLNCIKLENDKFVHPKYNWNTLLGWFMLLTAMHAIISDWTVITDDDNDFDYDYDGGVCFLNLNSALVKI